MNQRLRCLLGVGFAVAWCLPALGAETGTMLRNADLKSKPFLDAETLTKLPERAPVEVLARQGPWMQVRYQGKQGYVRMLQVRLDLSDTALARAPATSSSGAISRPSSGAPMVTTGVRGFDEQALMDAEPAPEQFELMVSYAATAEQAIKFAQSTPLAARTVPYYDAAGKPIKGGK
jgi:hypothetical protein